MQRSGGLWATVGIVTLALVAAALAYAALQSTAPTTPAPLASALTSPQDTKPEADPTPDPKVSDAIPSVIEPPLLMVNASLAYRGRTGTCLGGARLERTTNGGKTWRPVEVPASAILDVRATGASSVQVLGADDRCRSRLWTSTDKGRTWSAPTRVPATFVRLPFTTSEIATPTGVVKNPCPDRKIAPLTVEDISATDGAVLCFGGEVLTTADGGATWSSMTPVVGAQALAFEGPNLGWVLVRDGGRCPGYEAQVTQDGGATWQPGGCLGDAPNNDERVLPALSFSTPIDGMADLEGETYVTRDGGPTWRLPS
jgi:photosystem II stability/assembly factor-like uncharacterized protein